MRTKMIINRRPKIAVFSNLLEMTYHKRKDIVETYMYGMKSIRISFMSQISLNSTL